jgi:hypothetical protein
MLSGIPQQGLQRGMGQHQQSVQERSNMEDVLLPSRTDSAETRFLQQQKAASSRVCVAVVCAAITLQPTVCT